MSNRKMQSAGQKKGEKYLWLGYGSYGGPGLTGPINPGNIRAAPGFFDKLLEFFGIKGKTIVDDGKDSEEYRDPSW